MSSWRSLSISFLTTDGKEPSCRACLSLEASNFSDVVAIGMPIGSVRTGGHGFFSCYQIIQDILPANKTILTKESTHQISVSQYSHIFQMNSCNIYNAKYFQYFGVNNSVLILLINNINILVPYKKWLSKNIFTLP